MQVMPSIILLLCIYIVCYSAHNAYTDNTFYEPSYNLISGVEGVWNLSYSLLNNLMGKTTLATEDSMFKLFSTYTVLTIIGVFLYFVIEIFH